MCAPPMGTHAFPTHARVSWDLGWGHPDPCGALCRVKVGAPWTEGWVLGVPCSPTHSGHLASRHGCMQGAAAPRGSEVQGDPAWHPRASLGAPCSLGHVPWCSCGQPWGDGGCVHPCILPDTPSGRIRIAVRGFNWEKEKDGHEMTGAAWKNRPGEESHEQSGLHPSCLCASRWPPAQGDSSSRSPKQS